jgi:selenocysteine lyase/cysteine desulfurase
MSGHEILSVGDQELRHQFPVLERGLYFNHAAIGPWPRRTADAVRQFAEENLHHGSANYRNWYARETALRQSLADLVNAGSPDDIALLKNTTEGICITAWGLDWQAGDNVVIPRDEFASNRLPWLAQKPRGVEVREIDIRAAPDAESALIEAMDQRTRLLSVSAVQWSDGFRLDLEALGSACAQHDVLFFVDAIQQLGAMPMDVESCHIDFLAADAHKWLLAPEGIAVFYCRERARPLISLTQQGWHMFEHPWHFDRRDWTPAKSAKRFEAGSPNTLGQAALYASVELLMEFGLDKVSGRVLENTRLLVDAIRERPGLELVSRLEPGRQSGIVTFRPDGISAERLHRALTEAGVSCVLRGGAIRLSPHFYQGEKEMSRFVSILEDASRHCRNARP